MSEYYNELKSINELEFNMIKHYINYDKKVDELIEDKEHKILQIKIEIQKLLQVIIAEENEIKMIKDERYKCKPNYPFRFVNPYTLYDEMTKTK